MKRAFLVLCVIAPVLARSQDQRIVNGHDAKISSFPSMVAITAHDKLVCGGTLLNEEWILTAAHCFVVPVQFEDFVVQYGNTVISVNGSVVVGFSKGFSKVILHEDYDTNTIAIHDIAVARLSNPISDPPEGFRAKLPTYGSNVLTGSPAVAAGWGRNHTEGFSQTTLQAVDLVAFSAYDCNQIYKKHADLIPESNHWFGQEVHENNICAGITKDISDIKDDITKLKGACYGDSGGPLFVDGVQVGITSDGPEPCGLFPAVYTAISFYVKWIAEKTGINLEGSSRTFS